MIAEEEDLRVSGSIDAGGWRSGMRSRSREVFQDESMGLKLHEGDVRGNEEDELLVSAMAAVDGRCVMRRLS